LKRYIEPVLANHDANRVHVICYAEANRPDAVTARLQKLAHEWRWTCRLSNAQLAERIREDRIDILVDLAGHTANNRLGAFARKPAPIQVTWLGFLGTTGLKSIDYRLTDDFLDPPGMPVRDIEELLGLPGGMCCYAGPPDAPDVGAPPALRNGYLTFGSLHQLFKLNAQVFDLWSEVLKAVPTARLLMFRDSLAGTAQEHVRNQFAQRGIGNNRLDLRPGPCTDSYMGVYRQIDVTLDTFPVSGGVTTCESLWMGVPVLTLCGERPLARNSAALLNRVGLAEWVAHTSQQYVAVAKSIAEDLDRLTMLRAGLRERVQAKLCDAERFTRMLEETYRAMWRRWCSRAQ
jgi:predicted O-linked N-acetylglucosamine transferase (SPINDLY family)